MKNLTLVLHRCLGIKWRLAAVFLAGLSTAAAATFGTVIPLPGQASEMVLDQARGSLYIADFTAGTVDIVSTSTHALVSSLNVGGQPSGLAMSPDGHYLVVTNYNNFGVSSLNSVAVIDLTNLTRQNFAIRNPPLAVAFGANGVAYILTAGDLETFSPGSGTFQVLCNSAFCPPAAANKPLPVPPATFPTQITSGSMAASADGNWIFGVTDSFMFVYEVAPSILNGRLTNTLIHTLAPVRVSAAADGSYFMAGQYLLDPRLRVVSEFATSDLSKTNLGGHVFDSGSQTVYSFFPEQVATAPAGPKMMIQDSDNLTIRERLLIPENITGRMILAPGGSSLYALSDSGLTYFPLSALASAPQILPAVRQLFFQFDFCQQTPLHQQLQLGGSGDFTITATTAQNVLFNGMSAFSGTLPATVDVSVAPGVTYATTEGTTHGKIVITSNAAVNALAPLQIDINMKASDQRGTIVPIPGKVVGALGDPFRNQFYILEQTGNQVYVFNNSDLRLLGKFRTGTTPTWMAMSSDNNFLVVANSAGENLTVLNLTTLQPPSRQFLPLGHTPISVAADNGSMLVAARTSTSGGVLDWIDPSTTDAFELGVLGIYQNQVNASTAMVPLSDGSGIFIAGADGTVQIWDETLQRVTVSRQDVSGLIGSVGAGSTLMAAGGYLFNRSMVMQGQFIDKPNIAGGYAFTRAAAVRTVTPGSSVVDSGAIERIDMVAPLNSTASPVRMAEAPPQPDVINVPQFAFLRSLAGLSDGSFVSISSTGFEQLPSNFDAGLAIPNITAVTSAADFSTNVGSGGLISIFGQNLAPNPASADSLPLSTSLGEVCVVANGERLPLLYVSPNQINAQLPFDVAGQVTAMLHAPGGLSNIFYAQVQPASPSIFQVSLGSAGMVPAVVRTSNNLLATLSNPVRPNEMILIYATGLGQVTPSINPGNPGEAVPLANAVQQPTVTLGGANAGVYFAGLAPGFVGVYQLNVMVPGNAPEGLQIPLSISDGGLNTTTVYLRVVRGD